MKKDLCDLKFINEKIENELLQIKSNNTNLQDDVNMIKIVKNSIYEKTSKIFIYNLKKLIQIENTQKRLAKKIGISEDLLSKYKSGEAFPAIETILYICELYNINLTKFLTLPLSNEDIENIENKEKIDYDIFENKYYVYFLVTNMIKEGAIHEGIIDISDGNVSFKIISDEKILKSFTGYLSISDKMVFFNFQSSKDGNAYINMIKPNINKNKFVGGIAMLLLPSDANSKPCSQKILFSKIRLDRGVCYKNLRELLSFYAEDEYFGNVKISQKEDEMAYQFIEKLL